MSRRPLIAIVVLLIAGGVVLSRRPSPVTRQAAAPAAPAVEPTPVVPTNTAVPSAVGPDVPPRPRSLRGTRSDGHLDVDPLGRFVPSVDARRLFDYHLTASGEASPEAIRARIVAVVTRRLSPEAARDAIDLLDRYLLYRERARQLADAGLGEDDYQTRFEAIWALRRDVLGFADADALFADEESYDRHALERARLMTNPLLSDEERAAGLAAADEALPEAQREVRDAAMLPLRLGAAEAQLRQEGRSDADLQALRTEMAGGDAAERLAALDAERRAWDARLEEFRAARAVIEADASVSPEQRAAAIAALAAERFSAPERLRVEALDRLAGR